MTYKFVEKIYLVLWTIITVGMIVTKSTALSYIAIALILSQIFIIRETELVFEIFLLTSVAWGASLNLEFRLGDLMISDFSLLLLFLSMVIRKKYSRSFVLKSSFLIECMAIWFAIWGIAQGFGLENILQDLKLFLYIFIPYCFLISTEIDRICLNRLVNVLQIYVCIVFLLEVTQLASVGLSTMIENGFGNRDVAIIVQFVPVVVSLLLLQNRNGFLKIVFQVICFSACLLSFTRTVWISYLASIIFVCLFGENKIEKNIRNLVATFSFALVAFLLVSYLKPEIVSEYSNAVLSRLTDATNSNNTLEHRWEQSNALLRSKVLRPITLIGTGFGEITELKNSVFMENSILYYFWKYGLFITLFLMIVMLRNIWMAFRSYIPQIKAVSISLFIVLIIGNFSGNLNLYYFVPSIAFVFAYPRMLENYDAKEVQRENSLPNTL